MICGGVMMNKREILIRLWFQMWLNKTGSGIMDIFSDDVVYIESWGPEYHGVEKVKLWFDEWNTRGTVLRWDIKQFIHNECQTVVEWYFENQMAGGKVEAFDGISLITWAQDGKICRLQEFGCNKHRYDPYVDGPAPKFEDTETMWF